jgi:signal transduction histidine kinase
VTKEARIRDRRINGMSRRRAAWLAWTLCGVCVLLVALTVYLDYVTDDVPMGPDARLGLTFTVPPELLSLTYLLIGAVIASRLPTNAIGWIFCGVGILYALQRFALAYADYAIVENFAFPGGDYVAWFSSWLGSVSLALGVFVFLLFPDGRLPSQRWRVVAWAALCGAGLAALGIAFLPGQLELTHAYVTNPFGLVGVIGGRLTTYGLFGGSIVFGMALLSTTTLAALASLVLRLRRSRGDERQQIKWFLIAAVPAGVGLSLITLDLMVYFYSTTFLFHPMHLLSSWVGFNGVLYAAAFALLAVPVFTYIAILRYNLYDIDLLINRTLVYGALTACVVGIYVLAVVALGALFQTQSNLAVSLSATGLVAVAFQPLRGRLQRGVNRLMYGERDDPYAVISRLGKRLEAAIEPEAALATVVETIAQALKLPYAAILLKEGEGYRTAASHGSPRGDPETLPLVYQREEIGRLMLSPRAPGETFSDADRGLLEDLARQAEVAVHAVRLTADLQHSRERLVATREEERRRLRRDLHDGLGAQLAGLNVQAGTLRRLIPSDPGAADELVLELREELRGAIADIRRLVYDLRPPALDDLGLVEAMRQLAERYDSKDSTLRVVVEAPEDLPNLPAAVEVAVYRTTQEALTNVARHARATTCLVRLAVNDNVTLEIVDDGVGMPSGRSAGVGLSSMHERAEELGGRCVVISTPEGGTRVIARLPLEKGR